MKLLRHRQIGLAALGAALLTGGAVVVLAGDFGEGRSSSVTDGTVAGAERSTEDPDGSRDRQRSQHERPRGQDLSSIDDRSSDGGRQDDSPSPVRSTPSRINGGTLQGARAPAAEIDRAEPINGGTVVGGESSDEKVPPKGYNAP